MKMLSSFTSHVLMVRPYKFSLNQQTAADNMYQTGKNIQQQNNINFKALKQFDNFVDVLKKNKVTVTVVQDPGKLQTPDSIFPNNWISFHFPHKAVLYPMFANNRRLQRVNIPAIHELKSQNNIDIQIIQNYSKYEQQNQILQGTGSLVLDRDNYIAYASISKRTNQQLLKKWCQDLKYKPCMFHSAQYSQEKKELLPIYHTNVVMNVSVNFVIICLDLIQNQFQRQNVKKTILSTGKSIIQINSDQILNFAGNMLTVLDSNRNPLLVMSQRAYKSLTQNQIEIISKSTKIIFVPLQIIQQYGGGSARCMLAEIF